MPHQPLKEVQGVDRLPGQSQRDAQADGVPREHLLDMPLLADLESTLVERDRLVDFTLTKGQITNSLIGVG